MKKIIIIIFNIYVVQINIIIIIIVIIIFNIYVVQINIQENMINALYILELKITKLKLIKITMLPIYNFEFTIKCEDIYYMKH